MKQLSPEALSLPQPVPRVTHLYSSVSLCVSQSLCFSKATKVTTRAVHPSLPLNVWLRLPSIKAIRLHVNLRSETEKCLPACAPGSKD